MVAGGPLGVELPFGGTGCNPGINTTLLIRRIFMIPFGSKDLIRPFGGIHLSMLDKASLRFLVLVTYNLVYPTCRAVCLRLEVSDLSL